MSIWAQLLPVYNEVYAIDAWRSARRRDSWQHSATFDALLPKFHEARHKSAGFYQRFPYDWTLDRASYEDQTEVLYQHLALTAIKGLWHQAPDEQLDNPLFDNICLRLIDRHGIRHNSPCLLPLCEGWRFIRTTYSWFEFSALACDAYCLSFDDTFNIEQFDSSGCNADRAIIKPLWDVMIINGFVGWSHCHEILKPQLTEQLARERGTVSIRKPINKPNRPADVLNEFSLRFTMAHEVAHHLESVFAGSVDLHPELLADSLALFSLNSQQWHQQADHYAPLLSDASHVPAVAGQVFYFVLGMWIHTENVVGQAIGEAPEKAIKRTSDFIERLHNWRRATAAITPNTASLLDPFCHSLFEHIAKYETYAKNVLPELTHQFDRIDAAIISEHPQTRSLNAIEAWIQQQLPESGEKP